MKKFLVILVILVFVGITWSAVIYGPSSYIDHLSYVGSGNKQLDPLYNGLVYTTITDLTNEEIDTLYTVPILVAAAPSTTNPSGGTHQTIEVLSVGLIHNYSAGVWDANTGTIGVYFFDGTSTYTAATSTTTQTALLNAAADTIVKLIPAAVAGAATLTENRPLYIMKNTSVVTGAAATGVARVIVTYRINSTGL